MTRPVMTRKELADHQVHAYGRNYAESCDGYEDMEAEEGRGWTAISGWARDGYDLGDWPYVTIYTRPEWDGKFPLLQIVEGDRTLWSFDTEADREAAIDYLFLWYAAGDRWAQEQGAWIDREALDAGTLDVPPEFRGPFSWARLEAEEVAA